MRRRRAFPRELDIPYPPPDHPQPAQSQETTPELGAHHIVEYRVDRRVDVEHDPAEIQQDVVVLDAQVDDGAGGHHDDPQGKRTEGQQTDEEGGHYGTQHHHHLFPVLDDTLGGCGGGLGCRYVGVVDQGFGYEGVQEDEYEEGNDKKDEDREDEEKAGGKTLNLAEADEDHRATWVDLDGVLGDGQDRAGNRDVSVVMFEQNLVNFVALVVSFNLRFQYHEVL